MTKKNKNWPSIKDVHTIIFDFDGIFTDNKVYVMQDGQEFVRCDRADGLAIDFLRRYRDRQQPDLDFFIVSTEKNSVVTARAKKLQLACKQSIGDKFIFIKEYLQTRFPKQKNPFSGLIYFGNDLNDLQVMIHAGFTAVPADAHPKVKRAATVVLPQNGGEGFVRAAIEKLLNINAMPLEAIYELVCDR